MRRTSQAICIKGMILGCTFLLYEKNGETRAFNDININGAITKAYVSYDTLLYDVYVRGALKFIHSI